jgi:hypothetical protein
VSNVIANTRSFHQSLAPPRRWAGALILLIALLAVGVAGARADTGSGIGKTEISCNQVVFSFEGFANVENNTVTEFVTVNREVVGSATFSFNGPTGSNALPIIAVPGKYLVDAHATWKTNGVNGGFDHHAKVRCQSGFSVQKLQKIDGEPAEYTTAQLHAKIGQTVDYEVVVKNTGMVQLKFSTLVDPHCDEGTVEGGSGEAFLAPGESTTFTCKRLLTEVGSYSNEATVTGTPVFGPPTSETSNTVVTVVPSEAEFTIQKLQRVEGAGEFTTAPLSAGIEETVEYEIVVTNTGNVPEVYSEFSDPKCDVGTVAGGPGLTSLLPGESTIYTCNHVMVIKDARKGPYKNTASVRATPPPGQGNPVNHTSNTVEVNILGGTGETEFGCTAVIFIYTGFPNLEGNTVNEVITATGPKAAGVVIATKTFVFNGPNGIDTVPIKLAPGGWIIDAHSTWKTNGASGGFDHHAKVRCF